MSKIFMFEHGSQYSGEFNKADRCEIISIVYQDSSPVAWCLNKENGRVVGTNPSNLLFVKETKDE